MQTSVNLWMWRYKNSRYKGYHLYADEAACRLLARTLADLDFKKISLGLRQVPPGMPLILASADVKYLAFDSLRLFRDSEAETPIRWEEDGSQLDLYINGKDRLAEGLGYMLEGQWDFTIESISYWGLMSDTEYRERYSN